MNNKYLLTTALLVFLQFDTFSQQNSFKEVALDDMSAFRSQAGNWQVVGDVTIHPEVDIHHEETVSKKRKKKKKEPEVKAVAFSPGTGVLLNLPDETKKDNLVTSWEHGDVILELEVMLPKGSNSGIYLQGRYEIQLLDSWGVKNPSFSDIGGIYRNWYTEQDKIYMGKAPLVNAAKAPGLWQKFEISFQAPRFDANGSKVSNARLNYVDLNGVRIHENVEIPKLTGGAIAQDEVAKGPLMIQGDHGPVAFRNIRYKLMNEPQMQLTDLKYKVYKGEFETPAAMLLLEPVASGSLEKLTHEMTNTDYKFGILYTGNLKIPESGNYTFSASMGGIAVLKVDDQQVLNGWRSASGSIALEAGTYPFELVYLNYQSWVKPRLGLTIAGDNTYALDLHSFGSAPPDDGVVAPIFIQPDNRPKLLRAFLDYQGDPSQRLTHTIGVGEPNIHYVYNLKAGNLVGVWKGNFLDATPMWHDRGDGSFVPRGMIQYLSPGPSVAILADALAPFPDSVNMTGFKGGGYKLDENGRPTFIYTYNGLKVSDKIYPDEKAAKFIRQVTFSDVPEKAFFKLAEGSKVEELSNGIFVIGDKQYYITVLSGVQPVVRKIGETSELIVPIDTNPLLYSITW